MTRRKIDLTCERGSALQRQVHVFDRRGKLYYHITLPAAEFPLDERLSGTRALQVLVQQESSPGVLQTLHSFRASEDQLLVGGVETSRPVNRSLEQFCFSPAVNCYLSWQCILCSE